MLIELISGKETEDKPMLCGHFRSGVTGTLIPLPVIDQCIEPSGTFSESRICSAMESSQFNGRKKQLLFYL